MVDRPPTSTYRLQLHAGFTFAAAQQVVPYLARLGVSHLYLSPVLQAAPGSMHGYDVVDHSRVSADLGGEEALVALADRAHDHGLGIVCDVVPNHMAIPAPEHLNPQLWDLLRGGREAATASWFDIDWELCDGRLGLPILGFSLDEVIATGELVLDTLEREGAPNERVLRYHDHVFPIADRTDDGDVSAVAARQHYLLGSWRDKMSLLGYRRFFDVDTLIAVRVEDPAVFDATHAVLLDLHRRGVIDGFRIDHPDGLADPEGYLARLAEASEGAWVVVEKILEGDERMPVSWACAGTTGYDAASVVSRALAPRTRCELDGLWREVGGDESVSDTELSARRHVVAGLFSPELERLTRLAIQVAAADADGTPDRDRLRAALDEVLAHVEVYRAYLRPGERADQDQLARLNRLTDAARAARPDLTDEVDLLRRLLADVDTTSPAGRDLVVRFQQVCGPVMAKGVEDTSFYRFNRLLPLNEVGGDPGGLDEPGPERLHAWAAYQQHHHPRGLTTLSTHDTKRSEDVRARLLALADDPATWRTLWDDVRHHAEAHDVDGPTGYLVFQTLLGSWPIDSARLSEYVEKAIREAKQQTSWQEPDRAYEQRVQAFVHDCLDDAGLAASLSTAIEEHAATIRARTLSAKLIQLTLPGVPDVYQGCEAVALTLVDPDNRRPVDFDQLEQRLARLDTSRLVGLATAETISPRSHESPATNGSLDDAKLFVTATALRLRRDHPELFGPDAAYAAVPSSDAVVAFERSHGGSRVVTAARFMGGVAAFALPVGSWRDVLTGAAYIQPAPSEPDPSRVDVDDVFARLPVALLVEEIR